MEASGLLRVTPRVMIVRPYSGRMRSRVSALLRQAGLPIDDATTIPRGTSDDDAIAQIMAARPNVLVVPFNAHRDDHGELLDGLTLCRRLAETPGAPEAPVLMAVTQMAAANLRLASSSGEHAEAHRALIEQRILVLVEDELDDADAAARVIAHLRRAGLRLTGPVPAPEEPG